MKKKQNEPQENLSHITDDELRKKLIDNIKKADKILKKNKFDIKKESENEN